MAKINLAGTSKAIRDMRRQIAAEEGCAPDRVPMNHPELRPLYAARRQAREEQKKELRQRRRARKKALRSGTIPDKAGKPNITITRTISYRYNEADRGRLAEFYASREWKLVRYEVLKKYGPRCQCCGRTAADGVTIHVDHIKPLRVFWDLRLEFTNLQVLCGDCNEGKGARHMDDWRQVA